MCVTAAVIPMATLAATNTQSEGASPATTSASDTAPNSRSVSPRRSWASPSGTKTRIPAAYPSCVATEIAPPLP